MKKMPKSIFNQPFRQLKILSFQKRYITMHESEIPPYVKRYRPVYKALGFFSDHSQAIYRAGNIFQSIYIQSNMNGFKTLFIPESTDNIDRLVDYKLNFLQYQQIFNLNLWLISKRLTQKKIEGDRKSITEKPYNKMETIYRSMTNRFTTRKSFGKRIQASLFERLWEDSTRRLREIDIEEMSITKEISEIQKYTTGCCINYDYSLQFMDVKKGANQPKNSECRETLEASIYRNVFNKDESCREESVVMLAQYVFDQVVSLYSQDIEDISRGKISWVIPPCENKIMKKVKNPIDFDELEFTPYLSKLGKVYYVNNKTGESKYLLEDK